MNAYEIFFLEMLMMIFLKDNKISLKISLIQYLFISTLCFDAIVCAGDSLPILFIDDKLLFDITGCSMISVIDSIFAVCFISDENSSKRLVT
jgi:hypothetical protein